MLRNHLSAVVIERAREGEFTAPLEVSCPS